MQEEVAGLLEAVRERAGEELPYYSDALTAAFADCDTVFTRPGYAGFFAHCASSVPGWLARVVLVNAEVEGDGSRKLVDIWRRVTFNDELADGILVHAKDESRHSRLFVRLAETAFPGWLSPTELASTRAGLPRLRPRDLQPAEEPIAEDELIDDLVQMNIGEIRTRIHVALIGPEVVATSPAAARPAARTMVHRLLYDEVSHIAYTARFMERWAEEGAGRFVAELYRRRLHDFNELTVQQTEAAVRAYGRGRFPELLEV